MANYRQDQELIECRQMIHELSLQVNDLLEAMLFFAGVKRSKLNIAVQKYIEALDIVFEDDDGEMSLDEIIKVIEYLKKSNKELFKNSSIFH